MPIAHRDKAAVVADRASLRAPAPAPRYWRGAASAAELLIDVASGSRTRAARSAAPSGMRNGHGKRMIAGSLNRLIRNGRPPRANPGRRGSSARPRVRASQLDTSGAANRLASSATCSGGVSGKMPWPRLKTNGRRRTTVRSPATACSQRAAADQQQHRVEIALHRDTRSAVGRGQTPAGTVGVEADRIDAGLGDIALVQQPGAARKADHRAAPESALSRRDDGGCRRDDPAVKLRFGQTRRPSYRKAAPLRRRPRSAPRENRLSPRDQQSISAANPRRSR